MPDNLYKKRYVMDILTVKQLDTDKVKDLVYGLENFEKDKAVRAGLYAGGSILQRGGVMRLKSRMKSPYGHKGNLIKAFRVRVKRKKLGVLSGFGYPIGNHSWLLDQGTRIRRTKNYGRRGHGPALRYWEDTRAEDGSKAMNAVMDGIVRAVERMENGKS